MNGINQTLRLPSENPSTIMETDKPHPFQIKSQLHGLQEITKEHCMWAAKDYNDWYAPKSLLFRNITLMMLHS